MSETAASPSKECLGALSLIPAGQGREFKVAGRLIAVIRPNETDIYAIQPDCPHAGWPLAQGILYGKNVECPLHGWEFNLETGKTLTPYACDIATYPVEVDGDGQVWVTIGA